MLNIDNAEAHQLAREIAGRTGESLTTVVTIALRERRDRLENAAAKATADELLEIGRQVAASVTGPRVSLEDLLYDANGLPR